MNFRLTQSAALGFMLLAMTASISGPFLIKLALDEGVAHGNRAALAQDLFLSADVATPEKLEKEGKGSDRFTYAIGQLGLWKKGGPAPDEATLRSWKGNLAIANARTAPYGAAAMATLTHLKIDPKQYRLLTGANIGQTWQFVDTGNAELGFVAWANLVEAGKTGEAWAVPASFYPAIEQQGLVLKKGAAVEALVAWLKGPGQVQIKAAGYALP